MCEIRKKDEGDQWIGITHYVEYKCECGEWVRIYQECEGCKQYYSFCPVCGKEIPWNDIPFNTK